MKRLIIPFLSILVILSSCREEPDFEELDLGYDYFPNLAGTFIDYQVDSISYGIEVDTTSFFLRHRLGDSFVDGEGERAVELERYRRTALDQDWVLTDVWVEKSTNTTGERVEENERFVKMIFPLSEGKTWDGNSLNERDPWTYRCTQFDEPYSEEGVSFTETVFIEQRNLQNLVDQEVAYEVYARDIGMVFKQFTDIT
ncbi:MAG: hypothetical protein AAF193_09795, partial [Bacteroidota bacterium]